MKNKKSFVIAIVLSLGLGYAVHAAAPPQNFGDAGVMAANVYKQILDNDRVRVYDVKFKPGDHAAMHTHPDHVALILTDQKLKLTGPDGKSQELALKAGQALFIPGGSHQTDNIGGTEAHNIVVELKK